MISGGRERVCWERMGSIILVFLLLTLNTLLPTGIGSASWTLAEYYLPLKYIQNILKLIHLFV